MATGLVNGTDLLLKVGTTDVNELIIATATSCSLEISIDEIDQTNKDSEGWKSIIPGTRSWSVSSDALYQNETVPNNDFVSFFSKIGARTKVNVELTVEGASAADSNFYYAGEAYMSLSSDGRVTPATAAPGNKWHYFKPDWVCTASGIAVAKDCPFWIADGQNERHKSKDT